MHYTRRLTPPRIVIVVPDAINHSSTISVPIIAMLYNHPRISVQETEEQNETTDQLITD